MPLPDYPTPQWPNATGYAAVTDVQAIVPSWDPAKSTTVPTTSQCDDFLREATAEIDSVLMTRGYYVPLQAQPGFSAPAGVGGFLVQGVYATVWFKLRRLAAAYAAALVERARHGGSGEANEDANSEWWVTFFDDFSTRVETAADNFRNMGVDGPFEPEIDPASGIDSGSLGIVVADSADYSGGVEYPMFSKDMPLGGPRD